MYFMQVFQKLFSYSLLKYYERMGGDAKNFDPDKFGAFAKEHEGDWYKSEEFADIFIKCPAEALPFVARMYYGKGDVVKGGVNLSERVVECLKAAYGQFKQEQHIFQNALIVEMTLKAFGVDINKEEA